jgi:hypothetical protein
MSSSQYQKFIDSYQGKTAWAQRADAKPPKDAPNSPGKLNQLVEFAA